MTSFILAASWIERVVPCISNTAENVSPRQKWSSFSWPQDFSQIMTIFCDVQFLTTDSVVIGEDPWFHPQYRDGRRALSTEWAIRIPALSLHFEHIERPLGTFQDAKLHQGERKTKITKQSAKNRHHWHWLSSDCKVNVLIARPCTICLRVLQQDTGPLIAAHAV